MHGRIKWYDKIKGYGFIEPSNGEDIFVHRSGLNGQIPQENDAVEFEIGEGAKGPTAIKVRIL